jgi:Xaa-Pro aminopeptidase
MKPLLLLSRGDDDPDFLYACRFPVEAGLYVRFGDGDDLLAVSALELDRARRQARAARVVDVTELGWKWQPDTFRAWSEVALRALEERGVGAVRVAPKLPAVYERALSEAGIQVEIDRELFVDERRRKSSEEADWIRAAQQAAEAACREVVTLLAESSPGEDGLLWLDSSPLTSERLAARAQATLNEIGYRAQELIVAGSPESALPHFTGSGPIRADAPVIIDIFPRGAGSHYHGDLTRTVVRGRVPDQVRRMHEACCEALDAAIACIRPGANGRDVHETVCKLLVERGYGTTTKGFAGNPEGPRLIHTTGHGVGLEVHEQPVLGSVDQELRAGDVVTVEPGLYQVGLGGVRVEDLGMVTGRGFTNFTTLPRSLDPADYL